VMHSKAMLSGSIAVIGAGISGTAAARALQAAGARVVLWEKSRGAGGRSAERRALDELRFDHGAQYFTVRDPQFAAQVDRWRQVGAAAPWTGRIVVLQQGAVLDESSRVARWVGVPGMNALARNLAEGVELRRQARVARIDRAGNLWELRGEQGELLGSYDAVICSPPAPQTAELLGEIAPRLAERARAAVTAPCWAVMAALDRPLEAPWDGAFVHGNPLAWIARNSSKPGRPTQQETWVLHACPQWSREHLEADAATVETLLLEAWSEATGLRLPTLTHVAVHRWRFALPSEPLPERRLWDPQLQLGACGDWCGGPRVEGAFLSGLEIAGCLGA